MLRSALALATLLLATPALAETVTLGTDWKAEAEHGGYYAALANGYYKAAGLDVTIRPGGPQVNQTQLLAAGRLDASIVSNSTIPLQAVANQVPIVTVAAFFQKDPAVLIAHPGQGSDSIAALKGKPIMIGADTRAGYWLFLKAKYGFTDDQIRPYAFSIAPFLAKPDAIQQGYATSEPFLIEKAGVKPVVMLVADAGYPSYGALLAFRRETVEKNPDLVRRFTEATIRGWYAYLYGDPAKADALILKDDPDQSPELLAFGRAKLKEYGIVDSGDAKTGGIGTMTEARWRTFFEALRDEGTVAADLDWHKAYAMGFAGQGVPAGVARE